jgi:predicted ATPase
MDLDYDLSAKERELVSLRFQVSVLSRELEKARSDKMDREWQIAHAAHKALLEEKDAKFQRLLQLGRSICGSSQSVLFHALYLTLEPDQKLDFLKLLTRFQKILLLEIEQIKLE